MAQVSVPKLFINWREVGRPGHAKLSPQSPKEAKYYSSGQRSRGTSQLKHQALSRSGDSLPSGSPEGVSEAKQRATQPKPPKMPS